jgi:hypothetical protein
MHRIAIAASLLVFGGCATSNLSMERQGACSVLRQAGYSATVRVETSRVKWLNAGPPAMKIVFSIALEPTEQDKDAGIVAMMLDLDTNAAAESCQPMLNERISCHFRDGSLSAAGFTFRSIGESRADPQTVLVRSKSYWSSVSACQ